MCQDLNQSALIPVQHMYDVNEMLKGIHLFFPKSKTILQQLLTKMEKGHYRNIQPCATEV